MRTSQFSVQSVEESARAGTLLTPCQEQLQTPALLLSTRHGHCVHTDNSAVQLWSAQHGHQAVAVSGLQLATGKTAASVISGAGGGHTFLNLPKTTIVATLRDSQHLELDVRPTKNTAVYVAALSGGAYVSPRLFTDYITALQPDYYCLLADETLSPLSSRRADNATKRTVAWAAECLELMQDSGCHSLPLGSIPGAAVPIRGDGAIKPIVALDEKLAGYYVAGYGLGMDPYQWRETMQAVCAALPADKPRFVGVVGGPAEILENVRLGVDLLESRYAADATSAGCALVFDVDAPEQPIADAECASDGHKMLMTAAAHKLDVRPLVEGCMCYACANHTRAYIHHLLDTREMLGHMLLEYHNVHHMMRFMDSIRRAIRTQTLQALYARFGLA